MNKKISLITVLLLVLVLFLGGCTDLSQISNKDLSRISDNFVKCNDPYIRNGAQCCLDQNKNKICDKDELNNNNSMNNNDNNNNNNYYDNNSQDSLLKANIAEITKEIFKKINPKKINQSNVDEVIKENTDPNLDSDMDGIKDVDETSGKLGYVTDPHNADTDGDGLSDLREYWWLCDPTNPDTNGDFINDGDSVNLRKALPYKIDVGSETILGSADMDGDLLPNAVEMYELHLNPKAYSSDGDRYGDGQELFKLDSTTDNSKFSLPYYVKADPYEPATPDIMVKVKPNVELIYDKKYTEGDEKKSSTVVRKSTTSSFQESVTATVGTKVSTTVAISANPLNMEAGAKVEAYAGLESQTSYTFTGERFSSNENSNEAFSRTETDYSNTKLRIWLEVENIGNDILTSDLNEITINYYLGRDTKPFASQELSTSITNLKPGDVVSLTQTDVTLSFADFLRVADGEGITVKLEHFSFGEDQIYLENSKASGIRVIVDDENTLKQNFIIPTENFTIKKVLDKLNYSYDFENNQLVSFNGVDNIITKPYKTWSVLITRYNTDKINIADKLENTKLKAGDLLVIKYRIDTDGDGVSNEEETMMGTNPLKIDTDGDGLTDGYSYVEKTDNGSINHTGELTVGTNPLLKDSDFDYVSDDKEVEFNTDPTDPNSYPNVAFVYEFSKFKGESLQVIGDKDLSKTFNNKISSLIIPKGLAVVLYDKEDKTGDNAVFFGSVSQMDFFDNKATAMSVVKIKDLPKFELILKNTKTGSRIIDNNLNNNCLLLDIDSDKVIEASDFNCEVFNDKYVKKVNILSSFSNSFNFYFKPKNEIYWNFEISKGDWLHLVNEGSSELRKDYNVCLSQNIEKESNEEVRGYNCNNVEFDTYLNWKVVPQDGGWISLVNEGSSVDRGQDTCLWMNPYKIESLQVQGYNCNDVENKNNILWTIKLV